MESVLRNLIDHFPDLMDINLTATIVIAFVICVRQFLKKAPKIFSYAIWGIVLLRLLVPVSIESPMSFVPERTEFSSMVEVNKVLPEIQFETPQDRADNEWYRENTAPGEPLVQTYRSLDAETYLTFGWLMGIAAMLIYSLISYGKLKRKVRVVIPLEKGIYIADDIDTPFVMGFFRPQIYLPGTLDQTEQKHIIAHEKHHIHRGDHIFKALGFLALTIHWFNPFVWAAFILSGRDMEMSCDEAVIRKLGEDVRAEYSASLLNLATGRRMFSGTPLAFDEGDPTERVRNLARWKKPAVWIILISLIACIILAVCLLTDPVTKLPFMDDYHKVTYAELIDLRENETIKRTFNNAERDELSYRLRDLKKIKAYTEENSIIPIYVLKIEIENLGVVSIDCVSWNEDRALIHFNGNTYWIKDDEFIAYLRSACSQQFTAPASEAQLSASEWSVSVLAQNQTQSSVELVFTLDNASEEGTVWFGETYRLFLWDNNQWAELAAADERPPEPAAVEYLTEIKPGQPVYQTIDWYENYGNLPAGKYRIQMSISLQKEGEFPISKPIFAEFSLSNYQNWAVSTQVHEVTPESLVLTFHNELDDPIWRLPGYTIQSWLDGYWVDMDVGKTWHKTTEQVDFDHLSNPQNGMFIQWDGIGSLPEGQYLIGQVFCTDADLTKGQLFTVYASFEITGESGGIKPLENLPELYSGEQAMIDGCLVTRDGEVSENLAVLKDFIETTSRGEPAFIRIVNWYYGEESHYTAEDLTFDGSQYILEWIEDGRRQSRSYRYLKHFSGEKERENIAYDAYEHYVLVNDNSVSWQQIWESLISSQYGASIDHWTICSDYIYYTKHPDLPDKPNYAILEFMDEGLVTVTDFDRLEKIWILFSEAEFLVYEPKTHSIGVGLNLILTSQNGETMTIELDPDSDLCRINGEYVFYGAYDEPDYIEKLWYYLGIPAWPDSVYEAYPNALRP